MLAFIRFFDFLGVKPNMYYNKKIIHQTSLGGFFSIVTGCILFAAISFFVNILLSRSNYSVTMFESRNEFPFKNWTNEQISVLLVDRFMNEVKDWDRLFGYYADAWWNKPNYDPATGLTVYKNEIKRVELEKCEINRHFKNEEDLWRDQKLINSSFCIKRDQQLPVQYLFGDLNFTSIVFWIHRCINNTIKKDCFPKEKIEKDLENVFLQVRFKDFYVDHSDYHKPEKPYVYSDMVQASSTAYKRTWYYFRNVIYDSDESLLFQDSSERYFSIFSGTRDGTDLRTSATVPGTFSVASFYNYPLKQTFKRKYYKIQNMMADAGGIVSGLLSIAKIIYYFSGWNLYYIDLINSNLSNYSRTRLVKNFKYTDKHNTFINNLVRLEKNKSISPKSQVQKFSLSPIKRKITYTKTEPTKLFLCELFFPLVCRNRRIDKINTMTNYIKEQLDARQIIKKINYIDKITYLLMGNNYHLLESCKNPCLKKYKEKEDADIMNPIDFHPDFQKNFSNLFYYE
jgi:hypothetical protein